MFNTKKKYFKKKLKAIEYQIFDYEFKRFKTLEIREGIRKEYDQLRSQLEVLNTQITTESAPEGSRNTNIEEFKKLEDRKVLLERDVERMKKQMDGLDIEVNGAKASNELPEGHNGINQILDSFRELQAMVKDYIKKEC